MSFIPQVIVDEGGSVLESAIPVLLRWAPRNLILIGDHLQLAPFTKLTEYSHKASFFPFLFMQPPAWGYMAPPDACVASWS